METLRWLAAASVLLIESIIILRMVAFHDSKIQQLLKDLSTLPDAQKPYSFARTQLLWWTIIICSCFSICYAITGQFEGILNQSCLILLGLSAGTTATGRVIDNIEEANRAIVRHQDTQKNDHFWIDILSDNSGVSVHRFQALLFNLLFGIIFIINFISENGQKLPSFGPFELGLMGISSGSYLMLKFNENLEKKE